MGKRRPDIRLGGKELFIYYFKQLGMADYNIRVGGCTNKRILSERTGIGYDTLVRIFTRKGGVYFDNSDILILKLFASDIEKGRQSMSRRGRGGMEMFNKFIKRDNSY